MSRYAAIHSVKHHYDRHYQVLCHCPYHEGGKLPTLVVDGYAARWNCLECGAKGGVVRNLGTKLELERDP